MSSGTDITSSESPQQGGIDQEADRRVKLATLRDGFGIDPYGQRTDGLMDLCAAREQYDADADAAFKEDADNDMRPQAKVAGRIMTSRMFGNLLFMTVRDATGDIQLAISKKNVSVQTFKLAKLADLNDIVVAQGPLGTTKTGEITVWARGDDGFTIATKSIAPPPGKWHGLQNAELRYRKRYVDLYANPEVMATFATRSRIVKLIRDLLTDPPAAVVQVTGGGFVEVETPMMQPIAGGAAARPFVTHHNALDIDMYMRIAPELYLKRLLVGGMPRVFEINRNFRNEGIDHSHNPEFTMLELYQAFGDYNTMMTITETMFNTLASDLAGLTTLPFRDEQINLDVPFRRVGYHDLFTEHNGFDAGDHPKLVDKAIQLGIEKLNVDHDLLLNEVWEQTVESHLVQPTFVIDYPASLCPLTKRKQGNPDVAERFELIIAGMEFANAYTELNDPDVQATNFQQQMDGLDEEEATFRAMDNDFVEALKVGMPPAGGLGVGIDRLVMLLTDSRSIRDVILFPLMRPTTS